MFTIINPTESAHFGAKMDILIKKIAENGKSQSFK